MFLLLNVHIHVNIFSLYFLLNEHSISVLSTIDYFHFSSANNALSHSRSHSKPSHSLTPSRCCYYSLLKSAAWIFLQSWTTARAHSFLLCYLFYVYCCLAGLLHTVVVAAAVLSTHTTQWNEKTIKKHVLRCFLVLIEIEFAVFIVCVYEFVCKLCKF